MESRLVSKKEAARRQIIVAIKLFHEGEYECAITLAGAAENQLPNGGSQTNLFALLKAKRPAEFDTESEWTDQLNDLMHWLKHKGDQDSRTVSEFDAWVMLARALTKYHERYGEETREMSEFLRWGRERKLTDRKPS